ncbi:MAG: GTP 3',8-cyclase MoaA [Bacteroidales bacterium]|nr:GTP 3',8-cyclase MoaA [Bacteroidales bacterium]
MYDCYNRKINYLRISVTDRCNLRCVYCMPEEGVELMAHKEVLSFEEIVETVKHGVGRGIDKIRITGGEPLVRKGIVELVRQIASIDGIKDLAMTTNAILLDKFATELAEAGLNRVNISLDTMDPDKFRQITRGGNISKVIDGINAAKSAGLLPVKINCVIKKSSDEADAKEVDDFCANNGLQVRFIKEMDLAKGEFGIVQGGDGGNCSICNRMRLTANGELKPCLFSDAGYNIRELGIEQAYDQTLGNKPKSGSAATKTKFYNIGG